MTILHEIAEWARSAARPSSAASRHASRRLLMDQVGIALGGTARLGVHPAARFAERHPSRPAARLWTGRGVSSAPYAALANRAAGDELELAAGPECVAAAVAAAEVSGATAGDLLDAIAAGAEVEEYFRGWLMLPLERHGLHPPAVLGTLAACAAAACVMQLPPARFAGALAAAAALTPVSPYAAFSTGTSAKSLYGAWSQMLGLSNAFWSGCAVAGPATAIEGARGVAQALLDAGGPVRAPRFEPDGLAISRVAYKAFPCNRACHAPLTALAKLQPVPAESIDRIEVHTYPYAVDLDRRSRGVTHTAGQMKIGVMLALAILGRDLLPAGGNGHAPVSNTGVRALASRVSVHVDPQYAASAARTRGARLIVHVRGGRRLEAEALARWGLHDPATDDELRARFLLLAGERNTLDPWIWQDDEPVRMLLAGGRRG